MRLQKKKFFLTVIFFPVGLEPDAFVATRLMLQEMMKIWYTTLIYDKTQKMLGNSIAEMNLAK